MLTCNEEGELFCKIDGWHALWGTGAGAVLGCCSVEVLVTVRDGRVLGDVSGAGTCAALGCCWGGCFGMLVTVRARMDGRVVGRVLFGVSFMMLAAGVSS